jgi:hypothetical protein
MRVGDVTVHSLLDGVDAVAALAPLGSAAIL